MQALEKGQKAPDINLPLIGGGTFSLQDALAKGPVVLAFFKISCPVCQYSFPFFDRLARMLAPAGVQVIGVSQDDASDTAQFMRTYGVNFPVALEDTKSFAVSNAYGLTNVPTVFEVAPDGTIETSLVGWSRADLEAIYARYVNKGGALTSPLFQPAESVADFKAG